MIEKASVLIIDDSPTSCFYMETILRNEGYQVKSIGDGRQGLQMILRERPHCVVLDVVLPGMSGYEICRHIRSNTLLRELPIVMVSTKSTPVDKAWAFRQGATHYLVKPFKEDEMAGAVKESLVRYGLPVVQLSPSSTGKQARPLPQTEQHQAAHPPRIEELSPADGYLHYGPAGAPTYRSGPSPAMDHTSRQELVPLPRLIPVRSQGSEQLWEQSPSFFSNSNPHVRRVYEAIDGQKNIEALCFVTRLSREEMMRALRSLLMLHRIRLREPGGRILNNVM